MPLYLESLTVVIVILLIDRYRLHSTTLFCLIAIDSLNSVIMGIFRFKWIGKYPIFVNDVCVGLPWL